MYAILFTLLFSYCSAFNISKYITRFLNFSEIEPISHKTASVFNSSLLITTKAKFDNFYSLYVHNSTVSKITIPSYDTITNYSSYFYNGIVSKITIPSRDRFTNYSSYFYNGIGNIKTSSRDRFTNYSSYLYDGIDNVVRNYPSYLYHNISETIWHTVKSIIFYVFVVVILLLIVMILILKWIYLFKKVIFE